MAKSGARKKSSKIHPEFPLSPVLMDHSHNPLMKEEEFPVLPKVSTALYDFMSPYATDDFTGQQWERLIIMAIAAWNAALYPESMRESFIDRTVKNIPIDEQTDTRFVIDDLIYRKERFFGGFQQLIEQCDVMINEDGMHIEVISAVPVGV